MPQLRTSSSAAPSKESAQREGVSRIFGLETEYGVSVTGTQGIVSASEIALAMFKPVISRARSTNTYLPNGARLYVDVGSHPEYATAETRDPYDTLCQDLAGEGVIRRLALLAQDEIRAKYGNSACIHVYKNNVDAAGNSFGCHENYLMPRTFGVEEVEQLIVPFLVSRQIITAAGHIFEGRFELTQRAHYLDETISSATTRSRPLVNTRDEPHANADYFRRLHVILADSNRSAFVTWFKIASTHLVLNAIELSESAREQLASCMLSDPNEANRKLSASVNARDAVFHLADIALYNAAGKQLRAYNESLPEGAYKANAQGCVSALDLQYRIYAYVQKAYQQYQQQFDASLTRTSVNHILQEWRTCLDQLACEQMTALAQRLDWVAKKRIIDAASARSGKLNVLKAQQLDLDYHDIAHGVLFASLLRHGAMQRFAESDDVVRALHHPPDNTRAYLRGTFVRHASRAGVRFNCDWTSLSVQSPASIQMQLLNPWNCQRSAEFENILRVCR